MDKHYMYYGQTIDNSRKYLYTAIYESLWLCRNSVRVTLVHSNELLQIYEYILLDNPDVFYTRSYHFTRDLNKVISFIPDYMYATNIIAQYRGVIASSLSFADSARYMNDYEKLLFIHDYILNNIVYDSTFSTESSSVLGIVLNKSGVCEGISKYVKMALDYLAVKCIVVAGYASNPSSTGQSISEAHIWNMVEVDGSWYHLDVTFDLILKYKENRYDYFLLRDEDIKANHFTSHRLPSTSHIPMNYYFKNGLTVTKPYQLEMLIFKGLTQGKRVFQFKLLNVREGQNPCDRVMKTVDKQCQQVLNRQYYIEARYDKSLWVFEIEIK